MENFATQEDRLDYLLQEFKKDSGQYKALVVGDCYESKRLALRSLMNLRMPKEMPADIIKVQDEFLTLEAEEKGIEVLYGTWDSLRSILLYFHGEISFSK